MNIRQIITDMGGTVPERATHSYSAWRFPYTYAYDYMRLCGIADSRASAAERLTSFCAESGEDREIVCLALAYCYLYHYGIVKP